MTDPKEDLSVTERLGRHPVAPHTLRKAAEYLREKASAALDASAIRGSRSPSIQEGARLELEHAVQVFDDVQQREFDQNHRPYETHLSFAEAQRLLHDGLRMARPSWPEGFYVFKCPPLRGIDLGEKMFTPWINRCGKASLAPEPLIGSTAAFYASFDETTNVWTPGWQPTQDDLTARDWYTVWST